MSEDEILQAGITAARAGKITYDTSSCVFCPGGQGKSVLRAGMVFAWDEQCHRGAA